jgi:hypothetical protein
MDVCLSFGQCRERGPGFLGAASITITAVCHSARPCLHRLGCVWSIKEEHCKLSDPWVLNVTSGILTAEHDHPGRLLRHLAAFLRARNRAWAAAKASALLSAVMRTVGAPASLAPAPAGDLWRVDTHARHVYVPKRVWVPRTNNTAQVCVMKKTRRQGSF